MKRHSTADSPRQWPRRHSNPHGSYLPRDFKSRPDPPTGYTDPVQIVGELVEARVRTKVAERRRYQSTKDQLHEWAEPFRGKARDAAEAHEARQEVLAEIDRRLEKAEG